MLKLKTVLYAGIVALSFGFYSCENPVVEEVPDMGSLSGVARIEGLSDQSGIVVVVEKLEEGASAALQSVSGARTAIEPLEMGAAKTAADGTWSVGYLEPGEYYVAATSLYNGNPVLAGTTVEVVADEIGAVDELVLSIPGSLSGSITLDGAALANVMVRLQDTNYCAFTDSDGDFVIEDVAPATYSGLLVYQGDEPLSVTQSIAVTSAQNLALDVLAFETPAPALPQDILQTMYCSAGMSEKGIRIIMTMPTNTSSILKVQESRTGITYTTDELVTGNSYLTTEFVYPFVDEGEQYEFNISCVNGSYTFYTDFLRVTATADGAIGEPDWAAFTRDVEFGYDSESNTVSMEESPDYTTSFGDQIYDEHYSYVLVRGTDWASPNYWLYEFFRYYAGSASVDDVESISLTGEDEVTGEYAWRPGEYIDAALSGNQFFISWQHRLKVRDCGSGTFFIRNYSSQPFTYKTTEKVMVSVAFNANGGSFGTTPAPVNVGFCYLLDSVDYVPTRQGYRFVGWAKEPDATAPLAFPLPMTDFTSTVNPDTGAREVEVVTSVTLYAVWKAE